MIVKQIQKPRVLADVKHFRFTCNQWRISGMAGMARAMGATLTGAQKWHGKN